MFRRVNQRLLQVNQGLLQVNHGLLQVTEGLLQLNQRLIQLGQRMIQLNQRLIQLNQRLIQLNERLIWPRRGEFSGQMEMKLMMGNKICDCGRSENATHKRLHVPIFDYASTQRLFLRQFQCLL